MAENRTGDMVTGLTGAQEFRINSKNIGQSLKVRVIDMGFIFEEYS